MLARLVRWLVLLAVICASSPAVATAASEVLELDAAHEQQLGSAAGLLPDPDGTFTFERARRARFEPTTVDNPRFGLRWRAAWLRTVLHNGGDARRFIVWQAHPMPDRIDAWLVRADGSVAKYEVQARRLPTTFPERGMHFEIELARGERATLYLRYEGRLQASTAVIASKDAFASGYALSQLAHGAWYGVMLALFGYNLFLFFALRDGSYGYYLLHLLIAVFFYFARNAHIGELPVTRPLGYALAQRWNLTTVVVHGLSTLATTGFARKLFDTKRVAPRLDKLLLGIAATPLVGVVVVLATGGRLGESLAALSQLIALIAVLATGAWMWRRRNPLAPLYLLAWAAFIGTGVLYILRYFGVLPYNDWTEYVPQVGAGVEAVLLSLTLAYRVRLLQRGKLAAERAAVAAEAERDASVARERAAGFARILEATDAERRRIARDIHDGLGQLLSSAKALLGTDGGDDARARDLLQQSIEEARAISHGLHPDRLERIGLRAALIALIEDLPERDGLIVDADIRDVDGLLGREAELHVYRIAQEAVRNAYAHGNGEQLFVSAERDGDQLELVVENDGAPLDAATGNGLGLTSMRERAAALEADLTIEAREDGGARVCLTVPVETRGARTAPTDAPLPSSPR